jgi:hypothetical protein
MESSTNTKSSETEGLRVDNVQIVWKEGRSIHVQGCYAVAEVSYPMKDGSADRRLETLKSGGRWGVDANSEAPYRVEVEREQIDDLVEHLKAFGIPVLAPLVVTGKTPVYSR